MLILGLQGSPRKKGNTEYLLNSFVSEAERLGARTKIYHADRMNVKPCRGCGYCEKKGFCVIQDDEMIDMYHSWREAEVVVAATPIFFYAFTAQIKAIIDRSQALWSRKYVFKLSDPASKSRQGFLLAQGATKGKYLFDGVHLTARYFFDAIDAGYHGSLTYRKIENAGDMEKNPALMKDVREAVEGLLAPLLARKRILFVCPDNTSQSQMAAAFAKIHAGDKLDVMSAGIHPADQVKPEMVEAMAENGIDLAFHRTRLTQEAIEVHKPEIVVTLGEADGIPSLPGTEVVKWELPEPSEGSLDTQRDTIEKQVIAFADQF